MSNLGYIDAAAAAALGVPEGPIRLLYGIPGAKGFGEQHLVTNTSRMKQLANAGYPTAMAFVADVARNWTRIAYGEKGRLVLIYTKATFDLRIIIAHQVVTDGTPFWSVITGIPSRVERSAVAYER